MSLEWFVGRFHVGTPDAEIRREVRNRIPAWVSARDRGRLTARAVRIHHRNRRLYVDVMNGRLG